MLCSSRSRRFVQQLCTCHAADRLSDSCSGEWLGLEQRCSGLGLLTPRSTRPKLRACLSHLDAQRPARPAACPTDHRRGTPTAPPCIARLDLPHLGAAASCEAVALRQDAANSPCSIHVAASTPVGAKLRPSHAPGCVPHFPVHAAKRGQRGASTCAAGQGCKNRCIGAHLRRPHLIVGQELATFAMHQAEHGITRFGQRGPALGDRRGGSGHRSSC